MKTIPISQRNKIYSNLTFATAVLLIWSLHYEEQIAFIKLFIMKLPGITFCERKSNRQNCINPVSFVLLPGVYGWHLLSILYMFLANGIHSYTDIQLLQQRCCLGWMKTWSIFLTGILLCFLVIVIQKQLVNLMPFPDTGFCSGHSIVQPPLPMPFPQLVMETTFFISIYVLNMMYS